MWGRRKEEEKNNSKVSIRYIKETHGNNQNNIEAMQIHFL
jgi:hypothetical protein